MTPRKIRGGGVVAPQAEHFSSGVEGQAPAASNLQSWIASHLNTRNLRNRKYTSHMTSVTSRVSRGREAYMRHWQSLGCKFMSGFETASGIPQRRQLVSMAKFTNRHLQTGSKWSGYETISITESPGQSMIQASNITKSRLFGALNAVICKPKCSLSCHPKHTGFSNCI